MRAANTTLKFGAPNTGVMDGTLFREVLRSLREEQQEEEQEKQEEQEEQEEENGGGGKYGWGAKADAIEANMFIRAKVVVRHTHHTHHTHRRVDQWNA